MVVSGPGGGARQLVVAQGATVTRTTASLSGKWISAALSAAVELDSTEQRDRAGRVIAHLKTLDEAALVEESIKFFKWIILCHILWIKDPNGFCRSLGTGKQVADPVGMLRHAEIDLD
eukprot:COSAG05_NODE_3239_length_2215_cov_2.483932_1_plen_118_part_00